MNVRNQLSALAHGLAQQAGLRVEWTDDQWAWVPSQRTIRMAAGHLEKLPLRQAAGIVAHELGHCAISRYLDHAAPIPAGLPGALWMELLNVLEDPRVENWAMRRFPGARTWITAQRHAELSTHVAWRPGDLRYRAFLQHALLEWAGGWTPTTVADERLRRALDVTRAARRRYAEALPPVGEVRPDEGSLVAQACELVALARGQILPTFLDLVEEDIWSTARGLTIRPHLARSHLAPHRILRHAVQTGRDERVEIDPAQLGPARRLLWTVAARQKPVVGLVDVFGDRIQRGLRPQLPKGQGEVTTHLPSDGSLVAELVSRVQQLFPPQRVTAWSTGFVAGRRLNLRAAMLAEQRPGPNAPLWKRRNEPSVADASVLVLVDLSGSMQRQGKASSAVRAARIVSRALGQAQISCAVQGFQDKVIGFQSFDEAWSPQVDARLCEMMLEVAGHRPGGHNHPQNNDDGPCLLNAYDTLCARPEPTKVLIVISDGRPAGRHSGPDDLRAAVARIQQDRRVALSALGLGQGTRHVAEFYPDAHACVPMDALPRVLSETVLRQLRSARQLAGSRAA